MNTPPPCVCVWPGCRAAAARAVPYAATLAFCPEHLRVFHGGLAPPPEPFRLGAERGPVGTHAGRRRTPVISSRG